MCLFSTARGLFVQYRKNVFVQYRKRFVCSEPQEYVCSVPQECVCLVPQEFAMLLQYYTKQGFRVIGAATRNIKVSCLENTKKRLC